MSRFVVQEHHSSHLHWDFRLEKDGVLKSWAVPKGVPEEKALKRLAIQVEDHHIAYIDFKGIIPEGQYGAGTVKIWDSGDYELESETGKRIVFKLNGKRLKGSYSLVHLKEKQWLLIKL
jgi:DNA ligase D-like protein (predicted 3'-phosphoesterase)